MHDVNLLKAYGTLAVIKLCYKAKVLVLGLYLLAQLFEVGIELWKFCPKIIKRTFEILIRYEQMLLNVFLTYGISAFACQNNQFPYDIDAGKVDAWVGLREMSLLCLLHCL